MTVPLTGSVVLDGLPFRYAVEVNTRRRLAALSMAASDQIIVKLPGAWSRRRVEAVLRAHGDWILRRHHEMQSAWPPPEVRPGGWVYLMGERRPVGSEEFPEPLERSLREWYRREAAAVFQPRLRAWSEKLEISYTRLRISDATTRWGYCRQDGVIGLSWRLLQAPPAVIDYVMVHELIHRLHPHHRAAFWTALAAVYPGAREAQRWLRQSGFALMWHAGA